MSDLYGAPLPGNSNADKTPPEQPKAKKVISGTASKREKSIGRKIGETFTVEDASAVRDYVILDVLIPAVKGLIYDTLTKGGHRWLYSSNSRPVPGSAPYTHRSTVNYQGISSQPRRSDPPREAPYRPRTRLDYDEVVLEDRVDAETVLDTLRDILDRYKRVSAADLYDAVGVSCPYTYNSIGWTSLDTAKVERINNGYLIDLPRPAPLD